MASLRDIRKRIRSVKSTQKITRAMKMVAAARLRRAQQRVTDATPYAEKMEELLIDLAAAAPSSVHPLLAERQIKKRALVVFSSDRGLCGGFNANLLRATEKELKEDLPTSLITIGRKATQYFRRKKADIYEEQTDFWQGFTYEKAAALANKLGHLFTVGTFDRVDIFYSRFMSVITQRPTMVTIVPIPRVERDEAASTDQLYEPDQGSILRELLPRALEVRFYVACLNSLAGELGARMTAMDSATRNSEEMIDKLTLHMNRARQASITTELMEIISGSEAMK